MYNGPDVLAMTGLSALGVGAYLVGGWVLIVAGLAILGLIPVWRRKKKRGWKK